MHKQIVYFHFNPSRFWSCSVLGKMEWQEV